jgi:hypothetical protein
MNIVGLQYSEIVSMKVIISVTPADTPHNTATIVSSEFEKLNNCLFV